MQTTQLLDALNEVPIDRQGCRDCWTIYHTIPNIQVSRDAFASIVFCAPFTVKSKALPLRSTEEVEVLIEQHWLPWQNQVYDWLKMFGVCPYYLERINNTIHKIPIVPPFGSGHMTTYTRVVNKRHKQEFKWYWNNTSGINAPASAKGNGRGGPFNGEDTDMHFILNNHIPTIEGELTSPISSLIKDYRTLKIVRESLEVSVYQAARPTHIFEHHPPKNAGEDKHLVALDAFGERAAGTMLEEVEGMTARKAQIRTRDLVNSLLQSAMHNKKATQHNNTSAPYQELSEDKRRQADIQAPSLFERSYPLRPDYKYVQAASPKILADLEKLEKHIDSKAASVMDFPLELIQASSSARGASNVQGNIRYINEQIKATLKFFSRVAKQVYIQVYGGLLQGQYDNFIHVNRRTFKNNRAMMELYVDSDVVVEMQCNPIMSVPDIESLHMMGIMDKETMAHHAFAQYALPKSQISVSDWPDRVPKELLVKAQGKDGAAPIPSSTPSSKEKKPKKPIEVDITKL